MHEIGFVPLQHNTIVYVIMWALRIPYDRTVEGFVCDLSGWLVPHSRK